MELAANGSSRCRWRVVFPLPFGSTRTKNYPSSTLKLPAFKAMTSPSCLVAFRNSSLAISTPSAS